MLLALLALSTTAAQQPVTLTLAADTYLDRKAPSGNMGREPLLFVGIDKAILVKFPDLGIKIGMGKKIKSASLVMSLGRPGEPQLATASRVLKPWHEGGNTSSDAKASNGAATWSEAISGRDGLRWERDGASGGNDSRTIQGVQTSFANDILTIAGLESAVQEMVDNPQENYGFRFVFSNVAAFFSSDSLANGPALVLTFEDVEQTNASDIQVLMCEPTSEGSALWNVTYKNAGSVSSSQSVLVTLPGQEPIVTKVDSAIASGESKTVSVEVKRSKSAQPVAQQSFVVRVEAGVDANPSDNGLTVYPEGLAVSLKGLEPIQAQEIVTDFNERVFPFSKFGAWPNGCVERLRLVSDPANAAVAVDVADNNAYDAVLLGITGLSAPLLKPYAEEPPMVAGVRAVGFVADLGQVGLLPDTRDDVLIPRDLPIPGRAAATGFFDIPMNEWSMLSRSEVTIINNQIGKPRALPWEMVPSMVFFRVFTPDGVPPPGAKLDVYQMVGGAFGSQPVFSANLEVDGSALMIPRDGGAFGKPNPFGDLNKDGTNGWLLALVRMNETVQSTWIPVWQLWDEHARGNEAVGFIELKVQVASGPLDPTQNLALERFASDSAGRFPAEMNAVVDGKNETSLSLANEKDGYWIEVDLGRDRQIGQVQLVFDGPVWKQFRIVTYKTAQGVGEAVLWAEESNGTSSSSVTESEDGKTVLSYTTRSVRSRFLRIVPLSREAVKLSEIRVIPIRT